MTLNSKLVKNLSKISATLIILSPLAAPTFAQSEELRKLTRELLGSAFDNHKTEIAPFGIINRNKGRLQPVIGNIINDHASKLPQFQKKYQNTVKQVVELLIPIKTGLEYSILQSKYPNIKIQESPTGVAILADTGVKALPMYLLGKKIQQEFGFSFELAYSDGHPDLNMAWLTPFEPKQIAINIDRNKNSTSEKPEVTIKASVPQPVLSENAIDLGKTLTWTAPWESQNKLAISTANSFKKELIDDSNQSDNNILTVSQKVNKFPPLTPPPAITELNVSNIRNIKNSLIATVKIKPVNLKNVSIASSKLVATNKSLNYLYVEVADNNDLDKLKATGKTVNILRNGKNKLLARVGIYSNTNIGNRLKENKLKELEASGFNVVTYDAAVA